MLNLNIKEFFQQRAFDILVLLFIIHIASLVCSVIIQWIHPYLKSYVRMNNEDESEKNCDTKSLEIIQESDSDSSDDDYSQLIDNLQSFVDVSGIPLKVLSRVTTKDHIVNDVTEKGFEKLVPLRSNIMGAAVEKSCSRETQTNVTINPKVQIDYSSPKLIISSRNCNQKNSISSDEFESASSETSVNIEKMPMQLFCKVSTTEIKKENPRKMFNDLLIPYSKLCSQELKIKTHVPKTTNKDYRAKIFEENKLLETAISDFEKELAPIKEQIKVLKESLNGYISASDSNLLSTPPSASTFSIADTESVERFNVLSTTTCNTDLIKSLSHSLVCRKSPFVIEVKLNNRETPSERKIVALNHKNENCLVAGRNLDAHNCNSNTRNSNQLKQTKRSPIAEMYVKLSQSSLQSNSFSRQVKKTMSQTDEGKTVTYQINLNLKVGNLSSLSNKRHYSLRERDLLPILSDLEDIIGQTSHTHISLKPAKNK